MCPLHFTLFRSCLTNLTTSTTPTSLNLRQVLVLLQSEQCLYPWRELPQVSFLSQQKFCHNNYLFVTTNTCLSRQNLSFVVTKVCLSWQNVNVVTTKYFCRDKNTCYCLSQQNFCRDKNDTCGSSCQWYAFSEHPVEPPKSDCLSFNITFLGLHF